MRRDELDVLRTELQKCRNILLSSGPRLSPPGQVSINSVSSPGPLTVQNVLCVHGTFTASQMPANGALNCQNLSIYQADFYRHLTAAFYCPQLAVKAAAGSLSWPGPPAAVHCTCSGAWWDWS